MSLVLVTGADPATTHMVASHIINQTRVHKECEVRCVAPGYVPDSYTVSRNPFLTPPPPWFTLDSVLEALGDGTRIIPGQPDFKAVFAAEAVNGAAVNETLMAIANNHHERALLASARRMNNLRATESPHIASTLVVLNGVFAFDLVDNVATRFDSAIVVENDGSKTTVRTALSRTELGWQEYRECGLWASSPLTD